MVCSRAIQTLHWFWLAVNKCLQAIFVPTTLLRWALLLFLGDRTDCLLCAAAGSFLWLTFSPSWSLSQALWESVFVNVVIYQGIEQSLFTSVIFLPWHRHSQDPHKYLCVSMRAEIEGACDMCGFVFLPWFDNNILGISRCIANVIVLLANTDIGISTQVTLSFCSSSSCQLLQPKTIVISVSVWVVCQKEKAERWQLFWTLGQLMSGVIIFCWLDTTSDTFLNC